MRKEQELRLGNHLYLHDIESTNHLIVLFVILKIGQSVAAQNIF